MDKKAMMVPNGIVSTIRKNKLKINIVKNPGVQPGFFYAHFHPPNL
jgi:hypothetical protein